MSVPTLYDMPVSNNGARCRIIIYKKGLTEQDITILHPSTLGGLKSPEYLALNPQGKMPLLTTEHGAILESDTIARYLLDRFSDRAPSFAPATLQANPNPPPCTLNLEPSTLNLEPSTLNLEPSTLNLEPSTLNPQP
ncbi:hypothetical protein T484DRAFT_1613236 [Baffinella frigidus]|nr:hypothetical protein T484DRAFT_1613236 [Cryptophyta sp. CCMP2293]